MSSRSNKWQHDGIDAAETWWFGPAGCDESDAVAHVAPKWGPTRATGQGRPDQWYALVSGALIGKFRTIREAKNAAAERVAQIDREVDQILATTKG